MRNITLLFILFFSLNSFAQSQNRVNLEDISIKGEILSGVQFSGGQKNNTDLEKQLVIKDDFHPEMKSDIPKALKKTKN